MDNKIKRNKNTATSQELCDKLQITKTTLTNWTSEGLIKSARNEYRWQDVAIFLNNRKARKSEDTKDLTDAKKKLTDVQIELKKYELKEKSGELVQKYVIIKELETVLVAFRTKLLSIPKKLSVRLLGRSKVEIEKILKDSMKEALKEFARMKDVT